MRTFATGEFHNADTFEAMATIPSASVDMILADLPYGTTACRWDTIIPFEPLWAEYWRIAKPNAAIVLTASQPFTTMLITSQIKQFKYEWIWEKACPTGFANAKRQPLRNVEDVCVFYRRQPTYNAQGLLRSPRSRKNSANVGGETLRADVTVSSNKGSLRTAGSQYVQEFTNYPKQVLRYSRDRDSFHPTQKPVALFEYLIRTYSNEGDTVLDNVAGSGTTAIAAINAGRRWICVERDPDYFAKACERIEKHNPAETVHADKYS